MVLSLEGKLQSIRYKWTSRCGCTGLPPQYRASRQSFQHASVETEASGLSSKNKESSSKNLTASQSFSAAEPERSSANRPHSPKVLFPAKFIFKGMPASLDLRSSRSPLRGYSREFLCSGHPPRGRSMSPQRGTQASNVGLMNGTEYGGQHPNNLALGRRHSLSPLPSGDTREHSPTQPMAGRVRSGSALDLHASLLQERRRKSDRREARRVPRGPSGEHRERNLEMELNLMQFELLSLKQKMKSSFAHLEKEKEWLETNRLEERKQRGDLHDQVFSLEMELARAGPHFSDKRNPVGWPCLDSSQTAAVGQETALSTQRSEANQRATDSLQANQALREESGRLQAAYNIISLEKDRLEEEVSALSLKLAPALADRERLLQEKMSLHQQVQNLTLELERAQKKQEGFDGRVSALHSELVSAKTQVSHLDREKVLMKEELESVRQANKELSSEVAESRQRLEASLVELHRLEAEKKILGDHIQAQEDECTQLLGEKEGRPADVLNQEEEEEEMGALRERSENLKESQALLQREKDHLETHCLDLEEALHAKQEDMDSQLAEQQQVSQDGGGRWEQFAATLKTKEEALENAAPQSPTRSAKDMECRSEKQRLEEHVTSLEEQLAEKEQAWRERKQMKNVDQSKPESKTSPLELKGQREQFSLMQQQHLVIEQLKDLFRRRQEAGPGTHPGGLTGKSAVAPCEPAGMPISSTASEIQALRQKNKSLMKAKLQFQQQSQEIHRVSKQQPERSSPVMLVPRLSVGWRQELQSDSPEAAPQSDECASSVCGGESPGTALRDIQRHPGAEDKRSGAPSAAGTIMPLGPARPAASPLRSHLDLSDIGAATSPHDPRRPAEGEGAFLGLQGSGLLSPRPFGPQRPWSPFKFKGSPGAPEN